MASGKLGKGGRYDTAGEMNSVYAFDQCWLSDPATISRSCYSPRVRTEIEERLVGATFEALGARKVVQHRPISINIQRHSKPERSGFVRSPVLHLNAAVGALSISNLLRK